jgi:gliding motility-associated-like protein
VLTQRVELRYKPCACEMFVPTAFTPDNDGVNDAFSPVFECVLTDYSLKIFNLWGEVVFATQDPQQAWVGEAVPAGEEADGQGYFGANGLYHWSLQWTFEQDGVLYPQSAQGQVLLVR